MPYQVGIADAISDPAIERVTLVKPVRVGFTTLLTGALASYDGLTERVQRRYGAPAKLR